MTAAMALMDRKERLHLVPPGTAAEPGVYQKVATTAGNFWSWLVEAPGRFWGWLKRTFNLQPAVDKIKAAARWVGGAVADFCKAMGFSGLSGIGLLTFTTASGRWLLNRLVVDPARWVRDRVAGVWRGARSFFADNLGDFGNWVEARMGRVDGFLFGVWSKDPAKCRTGLFPTIGNWYRKHIAKHLALDSIAMRIARLVGTMLFGLQAIAAIPLLGLGAAAAYVTYAAWAALYASTGWQSFFLGAAVGEIPRVQEWVEKARDRKRSDAQAAAEASTKQRKMSLANAALGGDGGYRDPTFVPPAPDLRTK